MNSLKVYLVMRKDLKMRRGKEIAQACHAMQYLSEVGQIHIDERTENGAIYERWCKNQHPKIAVGCNSLEQLENMLEQAQMLDVLTADTLDAGHTEVPENTHTCSAIGPVTQAEADLIGLSVLGLR